MKVLVTGASGFVGSAVVDELVLHKDFVPRAAVRSENQHLSSAVDVVQVGGLAAGTDWVPALRDVDVVVHAAARVHVMQDAATDPLAEFRRVNVEGTLNLARQAAETGTRRFVFISSIKVNGEGAHQGNPYRADEQPVPADPYGVSKMEAEQGVLQLGRNTGMEVVIIRPPLVYGPGVKGNFQSMMRWLDSGVPLPLGAIHNKRSLVALDNLVDLIMTCIDHPAAANQIFLAGDGVDLSTSELLQRVAKVSGRPARLIPVPVKLLEIGAALIGKRDIAQRLCASLQVDISKTKDVLGWTPPISVDEGLQRTVQGDKGSRVKKTNIFFNYPGVSVKRLFDLVVALVALIVFAMPLLVVSVLVKLTSRGPALYWSDRIGHNNNIFKMPKFRSMLINTPAVATHLLQDPQSALTPIGDFLRKSSLDELPQLLSIIKGDMSLVGPRPALFNQEDLISLRTEHGVHRLVPGLTGWAQINGRDELPIPQKVKLDVEYLHRQSFRFDIEILWLTVLKVFKKEGVSH